MKLKTNTIYFLLLLFIFSPIFLSVSKFNEITFARVPGFGSFYGTLPISAFLLYSTLFISITKLKLEKIEIILLLFCSVFVLLSINFNNIVVLKNYIGLATFICSNILFIFFFNFLHKNKLILDFNKIFVFFFFIFILLSSFIVFII